MSHDLSRDGGGVRWARTSSYPPVRYERVSQVPLWFQIADALRLAIESGNYTAGQRLDSQRALCERFAVSAPTIRQSVRHLVDEGYVTRDGGGRGYLVLHRRGAGRRLAS